jgi:hypothetical protein
MKKCSICQEPKPLDQFTQSKGKPGSRCKPCYNEYKKSGGYNQYNKRADYFTSYQKELRKTEKHKAYDRSYRKDYNATFSGMVTNLLTAAKNRAKTNGLECDLDREWLEARLKTMKCEATGVDLLLERQDNVAHTPFRPSIDRANNGKGYTKDNCRIVCVIYNKAKSDYSDADVLRMAESLWKQHSSSAMAP